MIEEDFADNRINHRLSDQLTGELFPTITMASSTFLDVAAQRQCSSTLRSIHAVFSWMSRRCVSRSAVG